MTIEQLHNICKKYPDLFVRDGHKDVYYKTCGIWQKFILFIDNDTMIIHQNITYWIDSYGKANIYLRPSDVNCNKLSKWTEEDVVSLIEDFHKNLKITQVNIKKSRLKKDFV